MYENASSFERSTQKVVLGRLGSELALVYHDTLQASLPPALQALIDRLEFAADGRSDRAPERPR